MASFNDINGVDQNLRCDRLYIGRNEDRVPTISGISGKASNLVLEGNYKMPDLDTVSYSHMVGYNTTTGALSSMPTGGGAGGGDVYLGGPNTFAVDCVNTYQHQNIHQGVGSSVSFGTDTNVILKKSIIPTADAKYIVTNGLGELQAGIPVVPITDVDGLVPTLSSISGSISTNAFDIGTINTATIPAITSQQTTNTGQISANTGALSTLTGTTIPTIQGDVSANATLANGAVSKTNPNTVGATNVWSGQNTWNLAGGNRFINDIEIGTGVAGAGYLHLEDNKVTLYCGGGTKGAEFDCHSAKFYGSVSLGFGGQVGKITIANAGQAVGNPVGFEVNTDSVFNEALRVGAAGDVYQTVINTDSTGVAGGKGFVVNSNHTEINSSILTLGDLTDATAVINAYSKLKVSSAGLFKDLDPFAPTSSSDPGTRGDITWGLDSVSGINYWYVCVGGGGTTNWGRIAMSTGW